MTIDSIGARLAIVDAAQVHPHEVPDPKRVSRLLARFQDDLVLRDPLIVGALDGIEGFVLLDGTNRRAALLEAGYKKLMVQIVNYNDRHCVHLRSWAHLVRMPISALMEHIEQVEGVDVRPIPGDQADAALEQSGVLAAIHNQLDNWVLVRDRQSASRAKLLRDIVTIYEDRMERESRDDEPIAEKLLELSLREKEFVLVTFPRFSRQQVANLAVRETPIPSGITRHVLLCGRALRVNLALELLSERTSTAMANDLLGDHLSRSHPRRYLEPTILFDS